MKTNVIIGLAMLLCVMTPEITAVHFAPPVPVATDTTLAVGSPCLTPDELTVFFASEGGIAGSHDIFYATVQTGIHHSERQYPYRR